MLIDANEVEAFASNYPEKFVRVLELTAIENEVLLRSMAVIRLSGDPVSVDNVQARIDNLIRALASHE